MGNVSPSVTAGHAPVTGLTARIENVDINYTWTTSHLQYYLMICILTQSTVALLDC